MGKLKRMVVLALCTILALPLAACGGVGERESWENEWGNLSSADFGVYKNGELVQGPEALVTGGAYGFF